MRRLRSLSPAAGGILGLLVLYADPSLSWPRQSAPFTGRWLSQVATPQGPSRDTTYFLTQNGDSLTGAILTGHRTQNIAEGKVVGDEATWVVATQAGGQERRIEYHPKLSGDEITLTTAGGSGGPGGGGRGGNPLPLVAKRTSRDGTVVSPFADLPKKTLPALHNVSDGGLAKKPPMRGNSWNHFRAAIDDKAVREIADAMVSSGMKDAGYKYVNIDDTWEGTGDSSGNVQSNSKFPDMKALADFAHSKGLMLGLYSSPGPKTCAG
jgi:alpha-galactosidase